MPHYKLIVRQHGKPIGNTQRSLTSETIEDEDRQWAVRFAEWMTAGHHMQTGYYELILTRQSDDGEDVEIESEDLVA